MVTDIKGPLYGVDATVQCWRIQNGIAHIFPFQLKKIHLDCLASN